jgi:hypothetical protein
MRHYQKKNQSKRTISNSMLAVAAGRDATHVAHAIEAQLSTRGFACCVHSRGVFQFG